MGQFAFDELSGRRFEVAEELFEEGESIVFRGITYFLDKHHILRCTVDVDEPGSPEDVAATAWRLVEVADRTLREICQASPRIQRLVCDAKRRYIVGIGGLAEICCVMDGVLRWVGEEGYDG